LDQREFDLRVEVRSVDRGRWLTVEAGRRHVAVEGCHDVIIANDTALLRKWGHIMVTDLAVIHHVDLLTKLNLPDWQGLSLFLRKLHVSFLDVCKLWQE